MRRDLELCARAQRPPLEPSKSQARRDDTRGLQLRVLPYGKRKPWLGEPSMAASTDAPPLHKYGKP